MKEYEIHSSVNYMTEGGSREATTTSAPAGQTARQRMKRWYAKHSRTADATTSRRMPSKHKGAA